MTVVPNDVASADLVFRGPTLPPGTRAAWYEQAWPTLSVATLHGSALGGVRDQGIRGTCLAFATSAAHAVVLGSGDILSTEWLFWGAKQHDASAADGTTPKAVREALASFGQPEEAAWPYDARRQHTDAAYMPPDLNGAIAHVCASTMISPSTNALCRAIETGVCVVLGLTLTEGFMRATATDGRIGGLAIAGPVLGGHAVLAVGFGSDAAGGETQVIIRNSWGPSWGHAGHALVSSAYLDAHLCAAFVLS